MKLSIIVPVYNEEKTISEVLKRLIALKLPWEKEVIVVNDGSTDTTASKIRKAIKNFTWKVAGWSVCVSHDSFQVNIKIINHKSNQGKGAAVRTGINKATGDYILIHDADLEYNSEEIPKLLKPVISKLTTYNSSHFAASDAASRGKKLTAPLAVYGSRFMYKNVAIPKAYYFGNRFLTLFTNIFYGTKLTDMETCYKLLPNTIDWRRLKCNGFDIEPEITITLIKNKIPIIEVPIKYFSRSRTAGKKLTFKDAFSAMKVIVGKINK